MQANAEPDLQQTGDRLKLVVAGVVEGIMQLVVDPLAYLPVNPLPPPPPQAASRNFPSIPAPQFSWRIRDTADVVEGIMQLVIKSLALFC